MRKFLYYFLIIISPLSFIFFLYNDDSTRFDDLIMYQLDKIHKIDNNSTIFFGDSSCGNGVDAKLFDFNTYNLSLSESFISCGSLEILNNLIEKKKIPSKIYLMYTIEGYGYKKSKGHQIFDRTFLDVLYNKSYNLKEFLKESLGAKSRKLILDLGNDYVKQSSKLKTNPFDTISIKLSKDNLKCMKMISEICEVNNIDYAFLIGPNSKKIEKKSLLKFKEILNENSINFNQFYYLISKDEIGDSPKHISPVFKSNSTQFYKDLIK